MRKRKNSNNNTNVTKNQNNRRNSRYHNNHNHKFANKASNVNSNQELHSNNQLENGDVKPILDDSPVQGTIKTVFKKVFRLVILFLPFILIFGGLLVICMMFMAILDNNDDESASAIGSYYLSECDEVNVYFSDTETAKVLKLDDYVADVLYYEASDLNNLEFLKAFIIYCDVVQYT